MPTINDLPVEALEHIMGYVVRGCAPNAPAVVAFAPRAVSRRWRHVYDQVAAPHGLRLGWYDHIVRAPPGKFQLVLLNPRPSQVMMITPARSLVVIDVWMLESVLDEVVRCAPRQIIVGGRDITHATT